MSDPILVDTEAAAVFAGIRPVTMRTWARRYELTRYGTRMRARYDLREIRAVMDGCDFPGNKIGPDVTHDTPT